MNILFQLNSDKNLINEANEIKSLSSIEDDDTNEIELIADLCYRIIHKVGLNHLWEYALENFPTNVYYELISIIPSYLLSKYPNYNLEQAKMIEMIRYYIFLGKQYKYNRSINSMELFYLKDEEELNIYKSKFCSLALHELGLHPIDRYINTVTYDDKLYILFNLYGKEFYISGFSSSFENSKDVLYFSSYICLLYVNSTSLADFTSTIEKLDLDLSTYVDGCLLSINELNIIPRENLDKYFTTKLDENELPF